MTTGFKIDIRRRTASRRAGRRKGDGFRMGEACPHMPALANDGAIAD
jgi:ribosomal protein L19E